MTNIILLIDTAYPPWPTKHRSRGGYYLRSGSAWLGRSQKDGLPSCRGERENALRFKAINAR
jgi:hypothetical protein